MPCRKRNFHSPTAQDQVGSNSGGGSIRFMPLLLPIGCSQRARGRIVRAAKVRGQVSRPARAAIAANSFLVHPDRDRYDTTKLSKR